MEAPNIPGLPAEPMPEGSGNERLWHGRRCLLAGVKARGGGQGGAAARICSRKPDTSERQVLLGQACWRWLVYGKQKERVSRQPAAGRPTALAFLPVTSTKNPGKHRMPTPDSETMGESPHCT